MYLPRSLSVCLFLARSFSLIPPSLPLLVSPPKYLSLSYSQSVTLLLLLSFYFSLRRFTFISLTYSFSPPLCFVAHSPTHFFYRLAFVCLFLCIPRSASLSPTDAVCLWLSFSLQDSYFASFSFVSPPLSPSVSPDIHVEIFSHVRYRFTTPARSPWPLNLIPSTKPHCFLCVWLVCFV